jgi:predicted phage-related endonuclease
MAGELTAEEKAARRDGLGASDAGPVFGYGFQTPLGLWLDKVYGVEVEVTPAMQRGHDLEHVVAEKAERRLEVDLCADAGQRWHEDISWLFASLDYVTPGGDTAVDAKAPTWQYTGHEWGPDDSGPDGLPPHYLLQAVHQMAAVPTLDRVIVAALFVDTWELRTYEVVRDSEFLELVVEGERRWWEQHVVARVPPPISRPGRDLEAAKGWPFVEGTAVELPAEAVGHLATWVEANETLREVEKTRDAARAELVALVGDAEVGTVGGTPAVSTSYNRYGSRTFRLVNKRHWRR